MTTPDSFRYIKTSGEVICIPAQRLSDGQKQQNSGLRFQACGRSKSRHFVVSAHSSDCTKMQCISVDAAEAIAEVLAIAA